ECCSVGPHERLQIILCVLTAGRNGIPIQPISCAQHRLGPDLPGNSESWSPVILNWWWSKKLLPRDHEAGSMRIRQEFVGNARSLLRLAAQSGHSFRTNDVELSL